jgi:TonB family protein
MKRRFTVLLCAMLLVAASPPAPTPTPGNDPIYCPVYVRTVLPVSTLPDGSQTFAFLLEADGESGIASGALAIYAGNDRYEAPFLNTVVRPRSGKGIAGAPIVVRFARDVVPDAAYVRVLAAGASGPCAVSNPWMRDRSNRPTSPGLSADDEAALLRLAAGVVAEDPTGPISESAPSCSQGYTDAVVTKPFEPDYPQSARGASGTALIKVLIRPDGQLYNASVYKSSGEPALDESAYYAATHSTYEAATFRCRPMMGSFLFRVVFQR